MPFIQSVYCTSVFTSSHGSACAEKVALGVQYARQTSHLLPVSHVSKKASGPEHHPSIFALKFIRPYLPEPFIRGTEEILFFYPQKPLLIFAYLTGRQNLRPGGKGGGHENPKESGTRLYANRTDSGGCGSCCKPVRGTARCPVRSGIATQENQVENELSYTSRTRPGRTPNLASAFLSC